jgi:cation diffusion facilitator CzcD-associated flavoprotein CzcO
MTTSITNTGTDNFPYPGKSILVVGLGKTGMAAVKFFLQQGANISVSDSSPKDTIAPESLAWLEERITSPMKLTHTPSIYLHQLILSLSVQGFLFPLNHLLKPGEIPFQF